MNYLRIVAFITCALLVNACSTKSQEVVGGFSYKGEIKSSKGNITTIDLTLDRAGRKAAISSSLGISNLSVSITKLDNDSLVFEIPGYGVTYKGGFDNNTNQILGKWNQGAKSLLLNFEPTSKVSEVPKKLKPFTEEEIEVKVNSQISLAGTLSIPPGNVKRPALIMLGVAGKTDRHQTFGPYKSFETIADRFTKEGFVVLRCDDRGVGKSTGSLYEASYEDLIGDATAMISFLKSHPLVDSTKVGALGISEGAALTGILAGKNEIDFAIMLSYPALEGTKIIEQQINDLGAIYGFKKDQIDLLISDFEATKRLILNSKNQETLKIELRDYLKNSPQELKNLTRYLFVPQEVEEAVSLYAGPWYRSQLLYNPIPYQKKVRCPSLILYGGNDPFVNPEYQIPSLEKNLSTPRDSKTVIKKIEGINHIFQDAATGSPLDYVKNGNDFSSKALDEIVAWLKTL